MASRKTQLHSYPQVNTILDLTNENAGQDLVTEPDQAASGKGNYLYMDKLVISIYQPSQGGGKLEITDHDGNVKYITNTDITKDLNLDYGDNGFYIGQNIGLRALVSESTNEQASITIHYQGHIQRHRTAYTDEG